MILLGFIYVNNVARFAGFFTLVKEALIEIGCVVTSLVVGCHARALWPNGASPIVTMEH